MIIINIEIKPRNKIQEWFEKLSSKTEDVLFSIIENIPSRFVPDFIMKQIDAYTTKRINELQKQITQANWKNVYMQKAVEEIHTTQRDTEKAQ